MPPQKNTKSALDPLIPVEPARLSKNARKLQLEVIKQMLTLATSGFGLVAALAWNELIKTTVDAYVKPYFPQGSNIISLLIYAVIVTVLAVFITLNLTKIKRSFEEVDEKN